MKSRHIVWNTLVFVGAFAAAASAAGPATIVDAAKSGNVEAVRVFLKQPQAANVAPRGSERRIAGG